MLEGHTTASGRCARSPWPGGSCWPAPAATARCGSGTPTPASDASRWTATRTGSVPCARSPSPGRTCWPAAATTARCGSGTPPPASSAPPWKATPAAVYVCVRGHRGRPAAAGQRRRRRHGADLGPRHRQPAHHPGRPPRTASGRCARSPWTDSSCWPAPAATGRCGSGTPPPAPAHHPGRPPGRRLRRCAPSPWPGRSCWPAPATTARCGSGTRQPATARHPGGPPGGSGVCAVTVAGQELLASAGDDGTVRIWDPGNRPAAHPAGRPRWVIGAVPGHRRRPGAAGQRRRRRHGADLGPGHRPARTCWKATGPGHRRVPGHRDGRAAAGQRRRRRHGADLGPRDRGVSLAVATRYPPATPG